MRSSWYALAALLSAVLLQAQPTGNVLQRVYAVRYGNQLGTAFLIDYENQQYFVTARHLMASAADEASVMVMGPSYSAWKAIPVTVLLGKNQCVDVAVLVPTERKITSAEEIPYPYVFAFGQEVYFLGFPYGLYTSFSSQGGLGVALIKHAYVSARVSCAAIMPDGDKTEEFILLDGLNNPGFSGGPVVAPDMFSQFTTIRRQKLIGVISGFRSEEVPLNLNGNKVPNASIPTNTGIIFATPIEKAVDLIKSYVEKRKRH